MLYSNYEVTTLFYLFVEKLRFIYKICGHALFNACTVFHGYSQKWYIRNRNDYGIIINHYANYYAVTDNLGSTNRQACPDLVLKLQLNNKE